MSGRSDVTLGDLRDRREKLSRELDAAAWGLVGATEHYADLGLPMPVARIRSHHERIRALRAELDVVVKLIASATPGTG